MGNKALILCKLEKYTEALESTNKAVNIQPNDAHAWEINGFVLETLERYEEAYNSYGKALKIDSTNERVKQSHRRVFILKIFKRLTNLL